MSGARAAAVAAALILAGWLSPPAFAAPLEGGLEPLRDATGCVTDTGSPRGCANGRGLRGPASIAISPDGRHVYTAVLDGSSGPGDGAVVAFARDARSGGIRQLPGGGGCISHRGLGGCAPGRALLEAESVAVSPDGRNVYVADRSGDAVAIFERDALTGRLIQPAGSAGCVSDGGRDGCSVGRTLDSPGSVAVSPDGHNVYVSSIEGVTVLARESMTGALAQPAGGAGCLSESGAEGCTAGRALASTSVAVSSDGRSVYVAGGSGSIGILSRDPWTGALAQSADEDGCLAGRDHPPPDCTLVPGLAGVSTVAVTPDGRSVYAASAVQNQASAVFRFDRDPASGRLQSPAAPGEQCAGGNSLGATCTLARGIPLPIGLAPSDDGRRLYVASVGFVEVDGIEGGGGPSAKGAVAALDRDPTTGRLTQARGADGCVVDLRRFRGLASSCRPTRALDGPLGVAVSADGHAVYVAAAGSDGVTVLVRPIVRVTTERARIRRRSVALRIRCFAERPGRCRGTLSLRRARPGRGRRRGATRLAHRRFSIAPASTKTVRVRLSAPARRRLRGRLKITAVADAADGIGHAHTSVARLTLAGPRHRR